MSKTFGLAVVTPERKTLETQAQSLTLPAWEGSMGVLAGHAPSLALLREGAVRARLETNEEQVLSISGGFAEITPSQVTLFAETAELAHELDAERANLAVARAKDQIARSRRRDQGYEEVDIEKAQAALRRALVRLKISENLKRHPSRSNISHK
ncbi:MAG: ATP synthase F1 subunit epsilon [Elusimicrobia bacterium]|nr:ATP synthase F1 subunit epsilon [Elusimicrobiota bacterium]